MVRSTVDDQGIRIFPPRRPLNSIVLANRRAPGLHDRLAAALVVGADPGGGPTIVHATSTRTGSASPRLNSDGSADPAVSGCLWGRSAGSAAHFYHSAAISGPTPLHAADIVVPDLRGGFSHLIAALAAEGTSTVLGIEVINRGYEHFMRKLAALGANVEAG